MAITGINNSSYTPYFAEGYKNTATKVNCEKDSTNTKDSNVNDYSKYLQSKYSYMNTWMTSMQGVPTTVSVSSAFLQKCMNDPEKAKYLEENLAAIPDCAKSAVNGCLGTLTSLSYQIDADGNITIISSGTNDPDGKIARENAERKAKENREKDGKIKEKREAEKARKEKRKKQSVENKKQESKYNMKMEGNDVVEMTRKLTDILSYSKSTEVVKNCCSPFDIKA